MLRDYANKRIVVITGATSGIGLATKKLFEANGDIVITLARHNPDNIDNFFECDVSNEQIVKECFDNIGKTFKRIDVLICNAGFGVSGATELIDSKDINGIIDCNLLGAIYCYKYALPYIKEGGKIINISSVCAFFPLPYRTLYCASKSALNTFSLGVRMECKPLNIQVCSVCPGDTKTNFTKNRVKIYQTNERYGERIKKATEGIDNNEDKRMPASKVAKVVFKLCNKSKLKPYVIVGFKYKMLNFMMRFLPQSALLFFTEKFFGGHK